MRVWGSKNDRNQQQQQQNNSNSAAAAAATQKQPSLKAKLKRTTPLSTASNLHYPHPGWRMLTPFPFEQRGKACLQRQPRLSGSTNPCPTAVHMETFSSSVFKNSHLKNCYYHQDLHWKFLHPCWAALQPPCPPTQSYRDCNNDWASVTRFSAIHFRG